MHEPVEQIFSADVLAVLVLYNSVLRDTDTFRTLNASCMFSNISLDLFVYDNSPGQVAGDSFPTGSRFRITSLHDPSNPGVSAAFNAGAELARQMGKRWLLLLDQDTIFPPDAIAKYSEAIQCKGHFLFAPKLIAGGSLLSPCGYLAGVGYHLSSAATGRMSLNSRSLLNSGLLVELTAFGAVGGYDENVRVDFADFTFVNRYRQLFSEIKVIDLECNHGFSNVEKVPTDAALRRFSGYCRDGRAAAVTPLLMLSHAFLVFRRCAVLSLRYSSIRFLPHLLEYFSPAPKRAVP